MVRFPFALALCAGLAFAQDGDDSGITENEPPAAGSEESAEPKRATAHPARTPGKKVATVAVKKKVYSLALPADWVLTEFDDPKSELAWEVLLPGSTKRAELILGRRDGGDARSAPYYDAEWFAEQQPAPETEVRGKPVPGIVIKQRADGNEWINLRLYLSVRNNPYILQLSCSADDFAQADADMLAAARSFTADVEPWPPVPKGYETSQEGVWLIARAPDVTAPMAPLVKTLKDVEKRFRRDHGPLPKGDPPVVVLVHASKAGAEKIFPEAAQTKQDDFMDPQRRRLFAVPVPKDNRDREALLSYSAHGILLFARYGDLRPDWIRAGECVVAQSEAYCGKPLPSIDEGIYAWISTLRLHTLDEMEKLRESDADTWNKECFFYVTALREGKHKKQYRAFLDDWSDTGDALGAFRRHLAPIDQAELRDSTNKLLATRLKEEKRKQER